MKRSHSRWTFPFDKFIPKFLWVGKKKHSYDMHLSKDNKGRQPDVAKVEIKKLQKKKQRQWNKKVIREALLEN